MDAEIKKLWQDALLSGDYKQGAGCLRNNEDGYCCLGVLADIYIKRQDSIKWEQENNLEYFKNKYVITGLGNTRPWSYLPSEIAMWSGLNDENPSVMIDGEKTFLAVKNDAGASFKEIAELINYL